MRGCLIVVDYQEDFVTGSLGFPAAEEIGPRIQARIQQAREEGWDIIFTLDTHPKNYLDTHEGKKLPVAHCIKGTPGHALASPVREAVVAGDLLIEKGTFGSADLLGILQAKDYAQVELCGLVADICVLANATIARTALPQADVVVDASLTAAASEEKLAHALDMMESLQIDRKAVASR